MCVRNIGEANVNIQRVIKRLDQLWENTTEVAQAPVKENKHAFIFQHKHSQK